ncbi:hypothetical protein RJ55_04620 [Drechmeria coniospora]|nr:hypothetical protein RJ55_04620 [Drechmeria coniospora]
MMEKKAWLSAKATLRPKQLAAKAPLRPKHTPLFLLLVFLLFCCRGFDLFDLSIFSPRTGTCWDDFDLGNITAIAQQHAESPIQPPFKNQFWEVGQRSRNLTKWLWYGDQLHSRSGTKRKLVAAIEATAASIFPFITSSPMWPDSQTPLSDLRTIHRNGGRGIVIPVGGGEQAVRFAGHLISTLRRTLGSKLPIQVAYAGDADLAQDQRDALASLDPMRKIDFVNVIEVFDDTTLSLRKGGWAIKSFATLASRFEEVIVLDADAVFMQPPEVLYEQEAYLNTGAYLFHDRLLWQHGFRARHNWWKDQIKEPSEALNRSRVWTEDYAEECDSGVVVLDKSRLSVFVGLLHIAWQNTREVRNEVSYKLTYGDKETWWLGLELAGSPYQFEQHYGSILGWRKDQPPNVDELPNRVCSFVIAHTDARGRLLWYNGSLVKNKMVEPESYQVPNAWMVGGEWEKGGAKKDMSCMVKAKVKTLTLHEQRVLEHSIEEAKKVDWMLKDKGLMTPQDGLVIR